MKKESKKDKTYSLPTANNRHSRPARQPTVITLVVDQVVDSESAITDIVSLLFPLLVDEGKPGSQFSNELNVTEGEDTESATP